MSELFEGDFHEVTKKLAQIIAGDVLSIVGSEIVHPRDVPTNLTRVETLPGAACLRRFPVMHAPRQISRGRLVRAKAAPLQAWLLSIVLPEFC